MFARWQQRHGTQVALNGKPVALEWSGAAHEALARRSQPLTLELALCFSCLVKKFVRFHAKPMHVLPTPLRRWRLCAWVITLVLLWVQPMNAAAQAASLPFQKHPDVMAVKVRASGPGGFMKDPG